MIHHRCPNVGKNEEDDIDNTEQNQQFSADEFGKKKGSAEGVIKFIQQIIFFCKNSNEKNKYVKWKPREEEIICLEENSFEDDWFQI